MNQSCCSLYPDHRGHIYVDQYWRRNDLCHTHRKRGYKRSNLLPFLNRESIESFCIGGPKVTTDEIDGLIDEIIRETDQDVAKEKIARLEQIMKDNTIQTDLYPEMKAAVIAKDLKGFSAIERSFVDVTTLYK